jgi:hypothetical protein
MTNQVCDLVNKFEGNECTCCLVMTRSTLPGIRVRPICGNSAAAHSEGKEQTYIRMEILEQSPG